VTSHRSLVSPTQLVSYVSLGAAFVSNSEALVIATRRDVHDEVAKLFLRLGSAGVAVRITASPRFLIGATVPLRDTSIAPALTRLDNRIAPKDLPTAARSVAIRPLP
jgi:hypothetical protein